MSGLTSSVWNWSAKTLAASAGSDSSPLLSVGTCCSLRCGSTRVGRGDASSMLDGLCMYSPAMLAGTGTGDGVGA